MKGAVGGWLASRRLESIYRESKQQVERERNNIAQLERHLRQMEARERTTVQQLSQKEEQRRDEINYMHADITSSKTKPRPIQQYC